MKVYTVHEVLNATRAERDHLATKLRAINNYCQKNGIGDWGGSASEALIAHCDQLKQRAEVAELFIENLGLHIDAGVQNEN